MHRILDVKINIATYHQFKNEIENIHQNKYNKFKYVWIIDFSCIKQII